MCACQVLSGNGHVNETGWESQVEAAGGRRARLLCRRKAPPTRLGGQVCEWKKKKREWRCPDLKFRSLAARGTAGSTE